MAHFAKLGINAKVLALHGLDNDKLLNADGVEDETVGQQELERIHGWPAAMWIQTSYNTLQNQHRDGGTPFRGNYAGIGYTWDEENEIFWPKKPFDSWVKNISTASWDAPITYPNITNDGANPVVWNWDINWDEDVYQADNTKGWKGNKFNVDGTVHSDTATYDWNGSAWVAE